MMGGKTFSDNQLFTMLWEMIYIELFVLANYSQYEKRGKKFFFFAFPLHILLFLHTTLTYIR